MWSCPRCGPRQEAILCQGCGRTSRKGPGEPIIVANHYPGEVVNTDKRPRTPSGEQGMETLHQEQDGQREGQGKVEEEGKEEWKVEAEKAQTEAGTMAAKVTNEQEQDEAARKSASTESGKRKQAPPRKKKGSDSDFELGTQRPSEKPGSPARLPRAVTVNQQLQEEEDLNNIKKAGQEARKNFPGGEEVLKQMEQEDSDRKTEGLTTEMYEEEKDLLGQREKSEGVTTRHQLIHSQESKKHKAKPKPTSKK